MQLASLADKTVSDVCIALVKHNGACDQCCPACSEAYPAIANPEQAVEDVHHAQRPVQRRRAPSHQHLLHCCEWCAIVYKQDNIGCDAPAPNANCFTFGFFFFFSFLLDIMDSQRRVLHVKGSNVCSSKQCCRPHSHSAVTELKVAACHTSKRLHCSKICVSCQ